jgi:hypothetical protein
MGLDQYLTKRTYVKNWDHTPREKRNRITVRQGGKLRTNIKPDRIEYVIEGIGYWRKANQIHKWFVDNCQDGVDDCREALVSYENLKRLYNICKTVMDSIELVDGKIQNGWSYKNGKEVPIMEMGKKIKNPKVAQKLLPSTGGFFFGNTEYDQYYAEDIKNTIKILEEILEDEDGDFYYHSSW